jgi:hypothetical protein
MTMLMGSPQIVPRATAARLRGVPDSLSLWQLLLLICRARGDLSVYDHSAFVVTPLLLLMPPVYLLLNIFAPEVHQRSLVER